MLVEERVPTVSELGPTGKLEAVALDKGDVSLNDMIIEIVTKAESNWLKNEEVLTVLEFFQGKQVAWPDQPAHQPGGTHFPLFTGHIVLFCIYSSNGLHLVLVVKSLTALINFHAFLCLLFAGGRLFLFSRKKCRAFRNDKHNWRKKNDKKTIKETHEKLKVQDREKLNCYYAHAERDDGLQRRCYWILDKQFDDVVMVHYLCSSTSRIIGRVTPTNKIQQPAERSSLRPRRAASMRTKFSDLFQEDSEDVDQHHDSPRISGIERNDFVDDLGDPLDSFIAKLPDDFGLNREVSHLDQLPGDLSISANQIARIIETSPSKSPTKRELDERYLHLGPGNVSLGKMELQGLLDGTYSIQSPKKGLHGTLSDADSLLRGFSRLESLEFLKMVSPDLSLTNTNGFDGHLGSAGVAFVSKGSDSTDLDKIARSDSYNDNHPSANLVQQNTKESQKVSTIRRVVAPCTGTSGSSSGFESSFAFQDAGSDKHRRRSNPTNANTPKTGNARMTEAALAAKDHNIERRESLLRKVRRSKGPSSEDEGGLIDAPTLFRSQSHLVEEGPTRTGGNPMTYLPTVERDKSPEKAAVLLKQMSIDEATRPTADFLRTLSIDLPPVDENDVQRNDSLVAFGSDLIEEKSKDPSL